jgi:hypothetical protein
VVRGDQFVLQRCLDMTVYFGPLAVQASSRPGRDIQGQSFPYVPGGDEAEGRRHAWVGGPVQVVEYLQAEVPGHQLAEPIFGSITDEVQIADFLCVDLQTWAVAECLYCGQRIW